MAGRAYWKGYLKLLLVTCAVTLTPATTDGGKVRFHTINRKTGERIRTRYADSGSGKLVDDDDVAKGYAKGEDDYLILEDEDLDAVQLESTRTIDIGEFVPEDTIEWVYYDSPYFVLPDDEVGEEAFIVIREAMAASGVVGIARLVLGNRERAVMLQPSDRGIVLWTLRFGDEVRDEDEYFETIDEHKPDKKMLGMIEKIIADRTTTWSDELMQDSVQDRLLDIIKSKQKPKRASKAKAQPKSESNDAPANNVIDLMSALKKSLEDKPGGKKGKAS
ncbi:MAG: Ku protein [Devosia sp.]|jgi:DNA end-binding protein Ku|uniref:non-homologous end joining protein Ku n=1 Tax=unclassified Devosia TaxID=196773 RepID=UPI0019FD26A8|nr:MULTISPECIES: Ku protein [unclassified Devosia]MBF0678294.1 Ku protein [Devosia sp.]WEJ31548.1 Ku protein [Devosia sp. SD17-2]